MKTNETKEWQFDEAERIAQKIANGGKLLISITPPSRNSLTWKYEVRLAYASTSGSVEVISLTYWLASCLGLKVNEWGQLKESEFGTHRGFVVAYKVWQVLASFGLVERQFTNQNIFETL